MMRTIQRILGCFSLGCALLMSSAMAADFKLGVVNLPKLLEESPQAEAAGDRLEQQFGPRKSKLQAEEKEMKQREEDFVKSADILSADKRTQTERELVQRRRDLVRDRDRLREDMNFQRNEEVTRLQQVVQEAVAAIGRSDGFDLVLFDGFAYANPRFDITDKVMQRLTEKAKEAGQERGRKP